MIMNKSIEIFRKIINEYDEAINKKDLDQINKCFTDIVEISKIIANGSNQNNANINNNSKVILEDEYFEGILEDYKKMLEENKQYEIQTGNEC